MDVEVDDVVFDDEFVVGELEEQRSFDDNDEIYRRATAAKTTKNTIQSTSVSLYHLY